MLTLILDLDNTVYPVKSIGDKLFAPLFELMEKPEFNLEKDKLEKAKEDVMRIPLQKVADQYQFPEKLTEEALNLLRDYEYKGEMNHFEEYNFIKELPNPRFLVTTGFKKLQESKVDQLGIRADFMEVIIVDPDTSNQTKKDIFQDIIGRYELNKEEVLVVGDDPESEIKAGNELQLKTFLVDPESKYPDAEATYRGKNLLDLNPVLQSFEANEN